MFRVKININVGTKIVKRKLNNSKHYVSTDFPRRGGGGTSNHRYRSVILKSSSNLGAYRSTSHFNHAMGFWSYKIGLLNVKKQEEKRIELVTNRKPPAPACYVLGAWRKTSKALASHF